MDADLVLVHGFWSSPTTWDRLIPALRNEPELQGLRVHAFPYESPKFRWPLSPARIPDYNDIARSLPSYIAAYAPGSTPIAVVTHSQGGLILQRFMAWMLTEGRARELARLRLAVMLSCPNEGSEYLHAIRAVVGLKHHPQAGQLVVLEREVSEARRIVLRQIVNASTIDARHCPIPIYVYSGRTDNIVRRESAQSVFPNAEVLPGDHFSILDPNAPGNLTVLTLKRHLLTSFASHRQIGNRPETINPPLSGSVENASQARVGFRRDDQPVNTGNIRGRRSDERDALIEDGKPAETARGLGPPHSGRPPPGGDLTDLTDAEIQLLYSSVEAFQELMDASAQVRHATPHPVQFAEAAGQLQISMERTRHQLLALRNGINIGNWSDREWALTFRDARASVENNLAALKKRTAASKYRVVPDQDGQLGHSVDHLLCVLKEKYPSLFAD